MASHALGLGPAAGASGGQLEVWSARAHCPGQWEIAVELLPTEAGLEEGPL